jgi:hypothetical protein
VMVLHQRLVQSISKEMLKLILNYYKDSNLLYWVTLVGPGGSDSKLQKTAGTTIVINERSNYWGKVKSGNKMIPLGHETVWLKLNQLLSTTNEHEVQSNQDAWFWCDGRDTRLQEMKYYFTSRH